MLRTNIITVLAILFTLCVNRGYSQEREIKKGDTKFKLLQYYEAAELYKKAIAKFEEENRQKEYACFKLAECYRLMNNPDSAYVLYGELAKGTFGNIEPELYLRYADISRTKGDFEKARTFYKKYLKAEPRDNKAKKGLSSIDWITKNQDNRARASVFEASAMNSTYDDFAPAYLSPSYDQLVFTSNREVATGKLTDQWYGLDFSDLFQSTLTGDNWSTPELLYAGENVNSASHEGTPELNNSFDILYFTRCVRMRDLAKYCRIMRTEKKDGIWQDPKTVLHDSTGNIGHPAVSSDELLMIFASDREGSRGEKDLWVTRRRSKEDDFGRAVNLGGKVNTTGNEMFPFLYKDSLLIFASDGHSGYGGLDLFKSVLKNGSWGEPVNLLSPINSGYDDFRLITNDFLTGGYFTSNRPGGTGGDDIWGYKRRDYTFTIAGHVSDQSTLLSLKDAEILLINKDVGDTLFTKTNARGRFLFDTTQVIEDCDYEVIARKDNYFTDKGSMSTKGHQGDRNFNIRLVLEPIPEAPIVLPDILFPLDEWILEPQYQDSLLQLVEILNYNPKLVIELRSHTDSRASVSYNDALSQKRAQAVVDFLISKEIDPGRLVAKGYGERIPRTLNKNIRKEGYLFKKGTLLDDEFVMSLPDDGTREAAFHLNRRTEFAVLAKDYKPVSGAGTATRIQIITDTAGMKVPFEFIDDGRMKVKCFINDFSSEAIIDPGSGISLIGELIVLDLLQNGGLERADFKGNFEEIVVDDRVAENTEIELNRVRLGETTVEGSVVKVKTDEGNHLVIGKDMLGKLGAYKVDNENKEIIFK